MTTNMLTAKLKKRKCDLLLLRVIPLCFFLRAFLRSLQTDNIIHFSFGLSQFILDGWFLHQWSPIYGTPRGAHFFFFFILHLHGWSIVMKIMSGIREIVCEHSAECYYVRTLVFYRRQIFYLAVGIQWKYQSGIFNYRFDENTIHQ